MKPDTKALRSKHDGCCSVTRGRSPCEVAVLCDRVEVLEDVLRDFVEYERKRYAPRMGGDQYPPSLAPLMAAARAFLEGGE